MLQNLKTKMTILNFFICSLTLSIIILYFYLRITRSIYVITLNPLDKDILYIYLFQWFLITLFIFISILLLCYIKTLLKKDTTKVKSKYAEIWLFWYTKVNIFYKTYSMLFDFIGPNYTQYLVLLAKKVIAWQSKTRIAIIVFFVIVPRTIIIIILIVEIYNKQLHYYFYSLLLLLIPLIFKFILFILTDIGPRLLPEFRNFIIEDFDNNNEIILDTSIGKKAFTLIKISLKPEHGDLDLDKFMYTYYYPMLYIQGEMEVYILPKYSKLSRISLLLYLFIHILSLGYIIFILN